MYSYSQIALAIARTITGYSRTSKSADYCPNGNLYNHPWLLYKMPLILQYMGSRCLNTQSFALKKVLTFENAFQWGLVQVNMGEGSIQLNQLQL